MYMFKIVGCDLGNDSHKIVFSPSHQHRIKNSVSQRMLTEIRKDLSVDSSNANDFFDEKQQDVSIFKNLDVIIHSDLVDGRFFVGDLASRHGEQEVETGTNKADNPNIVIPLITTLGLNVPSEQNTGHFKIVCGLPITEYTQDRERYKQMIRGEYELEFLWSATKSRRMKISIDDVAVLPEGVAVLMNQMLNDTATGFRNPGLRKGQRGVIDIGAFTTDMPVIVDGKPDSDASEGISEGIANYLDKIVRYVNESYQVRMTRSQLVELIEKDQLTLNIRRNQVNLKPYVNEQFKIFAQKIVSKVDTIWANHFQIEDFFVVGGGAKALKEPLMEEMKKRNIQLTFILNEDPQFQNALGYWKFGKQKFGV